MTLAGHTDLVKSCAYSPDGRRIVSASNDDTLKIWDAERGKEVATYLVDTQILFFKLYDVSSMESGWLACGSRHQARCCLPAEGGEHQSCATCINCVAQRSFDRLWLPVFQVWSQISHLGNELSCPNCGKPVKLNPFTINADWRPIAKAWGNNAAIRSRAE